MILTGRFFFFSFSVACCVIAFLCGLLFVQRSGNYFVTMFDDYSAGLPLTVVVILENISVAWIYGTKRSFNGICLIYFQAACSVPVNINL